MKLKDLIEDDSIKSVKKFKKLLSLLFTQYIETVKVQMCSEKVLNFLINDILDFSRLNEGKFFSNYANFIVQDAVEEIKLILQYKAEKLGVNLSIMHHDDSGPVCVCTDMQRFQ